jgi:hypothetical protein
MRVAVCLLVLCLAAEPAVAAVAQPPPERSAKEIQDIKERVAYWLATCLEDWDAATHMTRKEWRITCERVAVERGQFLLQDPAAFTMGGKR